MTRSPVLNIEDPTFWVPPIQRQISGCPIADAQITSAEESLPATPTSPTGSHNSMALSISSGTVPIARTDKHVVLAMSPARPKVSSMQAKLDHTKIDTSLYDNVILFFFLFLSQLNVSMTTSIAASFIKSYTNRRYSRNNPSNIEL